MQDALRAVLTESYGIRNLSLQGIDRGSAQTVVLVTTPDARFVVKCYAADSSGRAALTRSDLGHESAAAWGLPTAPIVANRQGDRATATPEGHYVLYRYVEGRHHDESSFTLPAAEHLGRVIARLQQALARLDRSDVPPDHHWPMDVEGGHAHLTAMLHEAERGTHPTHRQTASALRSRIEALEGLAGEMRHLTDTPLQWVHGDCNEGNFLFDTEENVTAILDFDNLSRLPRGFDFMYALCGLFQAPDARARAALLAYLEELRPPRDEIEAYPILWLYCDLQNVWDATCAYTDPQTGRERHGRAATPAPAWWLTHWREMRAFFLMTYDAWARGG